MTRAPPGGGEPVTSPPERPRAHPCSVALASGDYVAVDRSDPDFGTDIWKRVPLQHPTDLPMTVADDFAYVPSSAITAVDGRRDRIAWRKGSGARGLSSLAVEEGTIFLTDAQGRLHTLAPSPAATGPRVRPTGVQWTPIPATMHRLLS